MSNRQFQNFCEYQFKGNYNSFCNFQNFSKAETSPNPNIMSNLNFHSHAKKW